MQSAAVAKLVQHGSLSPPRPFDEPPLPLRPRSRRTPCYVVTRFSGFYITFLRTRELGHPPERARDLLGFSNQPLRILRLTLLPETLGQIVMTTSGLPGIA